MEAITPQIKIYILLRHILGVYVVPRYKRNSVQEYKSILEMFAKSEKSNSEA